ncbi:MAG: hypothetical protein FWG14_03540 [Peptococcaceae bacterium]|nr:hypothetical protein [Peptococcaceae bacterium]
MGKKVWTTAKINLTNTKIPYLVLGCIIAYGLVLDVISVIITVVSGTAGGSFFFSFAAYLWVLVILAAIFIPAINFRRFVNLGGKRETFFWGSLTSYAILAGAASLVNTIFFYTIDRLIISTEYFVGVEAVMRDPALMDNHYMMLNMIELFGWHEHGVFFVIVQQFAFLFLLAVAIHTFTAIQDKWYGWVADVVIAAIISVFTPIAPLRTALVWFFNQIIFHPNALWQISFCIILAAAIYALNKPIFARKVI